MTDAGHELFKLNTLHLLNNDTAKLLGKTQSFNKAFEIVQYIEINGYNLLEIAAIDDSAANLDTLKMIGIGIAFNPTDTHKLKFENAKIPVLKGTDLRPFAEIVKDRRKIREYCEI